MNNDTVEPTEPTDPPASPPDPPVTPAMELPESLLTVETVDDALQIYCEAGLRPITIHAPLPVEGPDGTVTFVCSCGKAHDTTASGSSSIGKHPIVPNWQKREFTYDDLRDQLARQRFVPNLGVVLGKQPGGEYLIAIDVDDAERIAKLEQELGFLPPTPRCDSGRGYRLFYSVPPEIDAEQLRNVTALTPESKEKIPGVDVKVESGQVVVAPSLHANGKRYKWTVVGAVAPLPVHWALQLLKKPEIPKFVGKYTPAEMARPGTARKRAERYLEVKVTANARAIASCTQGNRNNTLYSTACLMFEYCAGMHQSHQWQWVHDELLRAAKACGLTETESRKTLASAERRVRESGKTRVPMVLAHPDRQGLPSAAPTTLPELESIPAPPEDPWQLAPQSQGKPIIKIDTELMVSSNAAISALRNDDKVYQRAGMLVHVTRVTREEAESDLGEEGQRQIPIEGSPQIRNLTRAVIKSHLSDVAVFKKWVNTSQSYKSVLPPDDVVGHVHDVGQYPGIRLLTSVVETPTLRADGTIMQKPGYDSTTGYLYIPGCSFPEVEDNKATQQYAKWALDFLNDVFVDFPYVNDSHRSVPIAALLTLISRPAILGSVPAVLFDASTRGSGKTLQTDAIAMIATGRCAPRMNYTSDDVELEKILGSYALKGSPFICLDNVPTMRPFGGGPIDRCITTRDTLELRVLGRSEVPEMRWRALIMATGNNMTLYGDTARRVLMARLEPKEESPEHRTKFRHQNLLNYISTQRSRLVSAALLILRAYWRAGRPNMGCKTWGSFEEWSRLVPNAIVFAGGADPMGARPESDEDVDPETQALSCLLEQLPTLRNKLLELGEGIPDGISARLIIHSLYGRLPPLEGVDALRGAIEVLCRQRNSRPGNIDATVLGYKLRSMRSRVVVGKKLVAKNGPNHTTIWDVVSATVNN